jgi:3-carboxy-cis,cis-muconate cycloisomerase
MAWHTNRGNLVRLCGELAILCGTMAKIAGDIALLMQAEIAEAAEPRDRAGWLLDHAAQAQSGGRPAVRANALRANGLMSTLSTPWRTSTSAGVGGWHAEWATVPELFMLAAGRPVRTSARRSRGSTSTPSACTPISTFPAAP